MPVVTKSNNLLLNFRYQMIKKENKILSNHPKMTDEKAEKFIFNTFNK